MANERARQLRRNQTDAERRLWQFLRPLKAEGFHFRRQVPIEHIIVDFVCYSARLVIEVDGGQHNVQAGQVADLARDAFLADQCFEVLRFWNNDVLNNLDGVAQHVRSTLEFLTPTPTPSPQGGGEYVPTAAEREGVARGLRAADEGRFASKRDVDAMFAKYRCKSS